MTTVMHGTMLCVLTWTLGPSVTRTTSTAVAANLTEPAPEHRLLAYKLKETKY